MPGQCVFNNAWLSNSEYEFWLQRDSEFVNRAKCKVCAKTFDIGNMGEAAVKSHKNGMKHKANLKTFKTVSTTRMQNCFKLSNRAITIDKANAESTNAISVNGTVNSVDCFATNMEHLKAEVIWTLHTVVTHSSFRSNEGISGLFSAMFPDSPVARKFTCGEDKTSNLTVHGLAPHFSTLLRDEVRNAESYVLLFDESLNTVIKQKQCDIHVRLWDSKRNEVNTHFAKSLFLGHATADDLYYCIYPVIEEYGSKNLVQISMDGPNVNWKLYERINTELGKLHPGRQLIQTGSCGIHTVHNSFHAGCNSVDWHLEEDLNNFYYFFKDSPARCEDFKNATGCNDLPPKYCRHRWLENISVVEKDLLLIPHLATYVSSLKTEPKLRSFESIKQAVSSKIFEPRLQFFLSVAREMEPFLLEFQDDKPMMPFLATALLCIIRSLMKRFVSDDKHTELKVDSKLLKFDITKSENLKDASNIDVGFVTKATLENLTKNKKLSDKDILSFRLDCRKYLQAIVKKLLMSW